MLNIVLSTAAIASPPLRDSSSIFKLRLASFQVDSIYLLINYFNKHTYSLNFSSLLSNLSKRWLSHIIQNWFTSIVQICYFPQIKRFK